MSRAPRLARWEVQETEFWSDREVEVSPVSQFVYAVCHRFRRQRTLSQGVDDHVVRWHS